MNENNFYKNETSYDFTDYYSAKNAFSAWQSEQGQEFEDFLIRQRKAELNSLVKRAIENELKDSDKKLIDLKWNKNYTNEEIAKLISVDVSTVYRRLEKITDILYEKLKYALEYRFGKKNENAAVLIKKRLPHAVRIVREASVSDRLRNLRKSHMISLDELSGFTDIPKARLEKIENGNVQVTVGEIIVLSEFFKISTDYILFGKKRVLRDPFTGMPTNCIC